jgi:iron complex outermembrane receptor protein
MKNYYRIVALGALGAVATYASNVYADEKAIETIVVIGEQENLPEVNLVGSVDVLSAEELSYEHVNDTLELFNKAPGVNIARYNQGIINNDIAIRGFAGDGVTPHAKLLIDGIPANFHNGYTELDQLFPIAISSIAMFKGTSDPRYGILNLAGNYNVYTKQDDEKFVTLNLGSFNTQEVQAYAGFSNKNLSHSYSAGYRTNEGYRDNTDLEKYSLTGNWQWELDNDRNIQIIARHSGYEGDSAGYLTEEQARENPEQQASFASQDGGDKEINHLSGHWDQSFSDVTTWSAKIYVQTFERERWVRFSEAGSLGNRYDDQTHWGFISTLNHQLDDFWSIEWGLDYEFQDVLEQRFGTIDQMRLRDTSNVVRDRAYDYISHGTYVQLAHSPSEKLNWNLAVRLDQLDGDFTNQDTNEKRDMFDFGTIVQPKLNIVYSLLDELNLFANYGRSFQHPIGISAYQAADTTSRDVSVNDGIEFGAKLNPTDALNLRISFWQQKASDEFIDVDGNSLNVGKTDRNGFDIAFNGDLANNWSYWGNYSQINTKIIRASSSAVDTQDNELRSIPEFVASIGLNYQATPNLVTRLHLNAQGDYYVNEANLGGKYGGYEILNVSARYDTDWGNIQLQINNLTDEFYEYVYDSSADGTFTIHSPGDGVNGNISVTYNL